MTQYPLCDISDKSIKITLYSYNLIDKTENNPTKRCMEDLNRYFPEEDMQMENEYMLRCSASFITGKCKLITRKQYSTHTRMATI